MSTRDFIANVVNGKRVKAGSCASVYFDGKHVYSYGYHYPLLINVAGKWLVNRQGYSNTTAKHINWASQFADYVIEIPNGQSKPMTDAKDLYIIALKNLANELDIIKNSRKGAFRKVENATRKGKEFFETIKFLDSLGVA